MRRRNLKKIIVFCLMAAMLINLCACSKGEKEEQKPNDGKTGGTEVIKEQEPKASPEATPEVTPEDTPTPVPANVVTQGPEFVVGKYTEEYYVEEYWDKTGDVAFKGITDVLKITSKGYEGLKKELEELNNMNCEGVVNGQTEAREQLGGELDEWVIDSLPWESSAGITVMRSDSKVFSMELAYYDYWGGAHPYSSVGGRTYNTLTGERLPLRAFVKDYDAFYDLLIDKLEHYGEEDGESYAEYYFPEWKETVHRSYYDEDSICFYVYEGGLSIYFNTYDLGPYVMGGVGYQFDYNEYKEYLADEYFDLVPDRTVIPEKGEPTKLLKEVFEPMMGQLLKTNYEECIAYVESLGYKDYETVTPEDSTDFEMDPYIKIQDPENEGAVLEIDFWPDTMLGVEYRTEDLCLSISHNDTLETDMNRLYDYSAHYSTFDYTEAEDAYEAFISIYK